MSANISDSYNIHTNKGHKVAVVCNSSNPDFTKYISSLIKHLPEAKVVFLVNKKITNLHKESKSTIITSSYTSHAFFDKYAIVDFMYSFMLLIRLRLNGVRIIHFITAHLSNIPQGMFARLLGIKAVFTIHDLIPHPDSKARFIEIYNKLIVNIISNHVVLHNQEYLDKVPTRKGYYMPLSGLESNFIFKKITSNLLFFGRIEPYKGIHNLVKMAEYFQEKGLDYCITIAGKGSLTIDTSDLPANIEIINRFISEDELISLQSNAAFTILPYDSASQSGVIIHSYAFATPVIAYDVGSLSEYVINGQTGALVAHNDFSSIVAFLKSMNDKNYLAMQNMVAEHFNQNYDSSSFARDSSRFYNSIMTDE